MREIIANTRVVTPLGRQGENNATVVKFPVNGWDVLYGNGAFELVNVRPGENTPYTCSITVEGDYVRWIVQSADLANVGHGKCELTYVVDRAIAKSLSFETCVMASIEGSGTVPAPYESRIQDLILQSAEITVDAARAEAAQSAAGADALKAEGHAVGQQNGEDVPDESPYYQNNAKYYAEEADGSARAAGESAGEANTAKRSAEDSQEADELAKSMAETAQSAAETAREQAETAKAGAEAAQEKAESAQEKAETAQSAAEAAKEAAEEAAATFTTDTTLSVSGKAADAKAIGDALAAQSEKFENNIKNVINVTYLNYYSLATNVGVGNYIDTNKAAPSSSFCLFIMKVSKGDSAVITGKGGSNPKAWALTDNDFKLLSIETTQTITNKTVNVTQDGYLILNANINSSHSATITTYNPNTLIYDIIFRLCRKLAYFEASTTASKAYNVNDIFVRFTPSHGVWPMFTFYRVTANIASGGSFTAGTNIEEVKLGGLITSLLNA